MRSGSFHTPLTPPHRFPTLDIGEDELYFRDTENRFTFGQCEPMTGSLIGCMPSMPQTMMKPHLFATDFFERVAFEVMLDNLKHYKRMNTGLQVRTPLP
jgi:hypothetical protein